MELKHVIYSEKDNIINSLQGLLKIRSINDKPKPNMPYGEGVNNALVYLERLSKSMGFKTRNIDGQVLEVEYGEGDRKGYIVTHIDVVPEGDGWNYPPYEGRVIGDTIYGRGAIDNKGPAIAVLFALKALKDTNIKLNTRVRLLFGTSEETTMKDLEYYIEKEGLPDWGLSPDNVFPIVNGEFGIMFLNFFKDTYNQLKLAEGIELIELKGGIAANSVPDYCILKMKANKNRLEYITESLNQFIETGRHKMKMTIDEEIVIIESFGIACHGGTPEKGVNAIMPLLSFLFSITKENNSLLEFISFMNNCVGYETDGKKLSVHTQDSSGSTVLNVGICNIDSQRAECTINIRFPVKTRGLDILQIINEKIKEYNIQLEIIKYSDSHYVDEQSDFIKKLQKIYTEITGKKAELFSLKGGTYARMLGDKGVAFGPREYETDLCGNDHKANEFVNINLLINNAVIYAYAIIELSNN